MYGSALSVSFIVFTYNSADLIQICLKHIKEAIDYFPVDFELILVDNNSQDDTICKVKKFTVDNNINIRIIQNPRQGLSYSRIKGIQVASKEYTCFIDDDNFIFKNWLKVLTLIISENSPDVIGGKSVGISDKAFPYWWEKYQGYYACGSRFKKTGFLTDKLAKMWGAGLTVRTNFARAALLKYDLLCTGRVGKSQMSGDDAELNYRLRLLGAKFYHSEELVLSHFMRSHRLNKAHLKKTWVGNAHGSVYIDIYRYLLTNKVRDKLGSLAILVILGFPLLTIKYKVNYFKYGIIRIKTINKRQNIQDNIRRIFTPRLLEKYE